MMAPKSASLASAVTPTVVPVAAFSATVLAPLLASDGPTTGLSLTFVNETLPANTLLRLLLAAPSSAWIEKVGAASPPSCTNWTWLAARSAVVNVVASTQLVPFVVVWNLP